jgi:gliding motility-associated-like protein
MKTISPIVSFVFVCLISFSGYSQMPIDFTTANNNQTFNTCNGFIIDSGGQGGTGYSNNESIVITVCPDTPGEIISVVFNLFSLDPTNTGTQQNPNVDYMAVYDGTSTAANSLGVYNSNQLQGVVIEATALNASGCITLEFYSNSTGTGMFTASVSCETPCNDPQAGGMILNGITTDSIRVCTGDTISFQDQGSFAQPGFTLSNYMWDFMDGDTANGTSVSHVYDVPGIYNVQLFVTDNNGCTNPNLIDLQVLVGTIPDFTGFPGDTSICLGESASFAAHPETYEVLWNGFPGSQSVDDGCLPDTLLGVSQDIDLLQTGFSAGSTIQNVNDIVSICLDLEHSFMGDLVIMIECPNGQNAILHQQGGGGTQIGVPVQADNVDCSDPSTMGTPFTYCFTPSATETWVEWVNNNPGINTIPAGNYESIDPLSNLVGCPANGVWTLTVIDNWAADDGTLFSFGLTLDPSYYPPIQTFQPQIGQASDSSFWHNPQFETFLSADADSLVVTPTQSGAFTYNYFVMDDFGCEYDTSLVLTVDALAPTFAGNDTTLCDATGLQLDGQIAGLVTTCDYTLTMEDDFGDAWNGSTLTITVNGVPTTYSCANPSIQVETLQIPPGANVTVTFNAIGTFPSECSYEIVDPNGVVLVSQGSGLFANVTDNFVANCVPNYAFEWSPAASVSDPSIADPLLTGTGQQTLVLSTYPVGHPLCATSDTIVVSVSGAPNPGNDSTIQVCQSAAPFDLFPLLGPGASPTGSWLDPLGNPVNMPYDPATMAIGDYTYVADSNGCTDQAIITINQITTDITSVVVTDVSCNGGNDGEIVITGNNIDNYTLNGGPNVPAQSPFTIDALNAGTYTVTVFSADGCFDEQDIDVLEPTTVQLNSVTTDASCFAYCDGQVQVNASGGTGPYNYTWPQGVNGDQMGQGLDHCAGNYTVTVTDNNGCTEQISYDILEPANVEPSIQGDALSGCYPHTVNFQNTTNSNNIQTTEVDLGDGTVLVLNGTTGFTHQYDSPGLFTVTITLTTTDGCVYSEIYNNYVDVYNSPNADFTVNPDNISMLEPESGLLNQSSNDVVSWNWVINSGTPATSTSENVSPVIFPFDSPGQYPVTLTVVNDHGCIDSITKYVTIVNDVLLFAPNTFTPDGDEFNQTWKVHISGIDVYDFDLELYNRWGQIIWESHDPSVGWDGTYNGKTVQDGTYTWLIRCADIVNDDKYTFEGHVTIIR